MTVLDSKIKIFPELLILIESKNFLEISCIIDSLLFHLTLHYVVRENVVVVLDNFILIVEFLKGKQMIQIS